MAAKNLGAALDRVREILETAREQDGQGPNLQEVGRRKAYRQAINQALAEIEAARPRATSQ
jgi:hypothetical protein